MHSKGSILVKYTRTSQAYIVKNILFRSANQHMTRQSQPVVCLIGQIKCYPLAKKKKQEKESRIGDFLEKSKSPCLIKKYIYIFS